MQDIGSISFSNSDILLKDVGQNSHEYLELFAEKKGLSAYELTKLLNLKRSIDYKNVNKKLHKLAKLNLIKIIELQQENRRGTIPYELTNEGIFHVLKNGPTPHLIFTANKFIQNYKNNDFFKYLLYPLISFKTIDDICTKTEIDFHTTDPNNGLLKHIEKDISKINVDSIHILQFFTGLFEYLRNCCFKIQQVLKEISYKKLNVKSTSSYYYPQIQTYGKDFNHLIIFLKSEKIIDNIQPKDIKFKHLAIIVIKKEDVEVIITPRLKELSIIRINKNNKEIKKFRYDAAKVNFSYKRIKSFFNYEEKRLENLGTEMGSFLQAFVMNLIFMISEDNAIPKNEFNKSYEKNESKFIKALVNDEKFVEYAKSLVNDLNQNFTKMMSMIN